MDKSQQREQIIESLLPILDNIIVSQDERLNMAKYQFYGPAAKIAADFSKTHEERAQEVVDMIRKDKRFKRLLEEPDDTTKFVDYFIQKIEENRGNLVELKIEPVTALPAIFRLAFNDRFGGSTPEERKKMFEEFLISLEQ